MFILLVCCTVLTPREICLGPVRSEFAFGLVVRHQYIKGSLIEECFYLFHSVSRSCVMTIDLQET